MDLLKRVQEARAAKGMTTHMSSTRGPQPSLQALATPDPGISRALIIEKKPKNKVLKQYFEQVIQEAVDEEDNA